MKNISSETYFKCYEVEKYAKECCHRNHRNSIICWGNTLIQLYQFDNREY